MVYGWNTKSWLNSTENRQTKRERADFTAKYEAGEVTLKKTDPKDFMTCTCRSFRYPHTLNAHAKLKSDHDWRPFEVRERQESSERQEWSTIR